MWPHHTLFKHDLKIAYLPPAFMTEYQTADYLPPPPPPPPPPRYPLGTPLASAFACYGSSDFILDCQGTPISRIVYAFFGGSPDVACSESDYGGMSTQVYDAMHENTTCMSPVFESGLASRAVGLVSYTISSSAAAQAWLPDPCVGMSKWLYAKYECF